MSSDKLNILVIGSGGREHALAWKLSQSQRADKLYVAPGNGGTAEFAQNIDLAVTDTPGLIKFAQENNIGLTVVGPDDALAGGIVDDFQAAGLKIFGPTKAAAQVEASKAYAKNIMTEAGIPTAAYKTFSDLDVALEHVQSQAYPIFVKASGLALGKGAVRCDSPADAAETLTAMMRGGRFGEAGKTVVIESFLDGPELSLHAFCDGRTYRMLPSSQDNKAVYDGGKGPNTGGMGTIAPLPIVNTRKVDEIAKLVVEPLLTALTSHGQPFSGLLYPGIKLTGGGPKIVEYNARFGDPETQVYMRLLESDLLEILLACAENSLDKVEPAWTNQYAVCVVAASGGYPDAYQKGKVITGIAEAEALPGVKVFHAGTAQQNGQLVTNGGRVLGISAVGNSLETARQLAYKAIGLIHFDGMHYRKDIGVS